MAFPILRKLFSQNPLASGRSRRKRLDPARPRRGAALVLEPLEDRLAPATNISIIAGAAGAGNLDHFLGAGNGTITAASDPGDTAATLSVGALQGVGAGAPISITADATIAFGDIGALNLQTGSGAQASFSTNTGALTFANVLNTVITSGGSLTFSAGANLTVANLNTNGGDVVLTAGTSAAGNVTFANILTNGSGNIALQATNASGGAITQVGSTITAVGQAINATATGNIVVNALRGTTVNLTSNTGSVNSSGSQSVQASAQLTVSAATGIALNTLAAALQAGNSTSGDISITQAAAPAQTLTINGSGVINNAAGGVIAITNSGAGITVTAGVASQNGNIMLAATDLQINAGVDSGTAVTTLANSTAGLPIDLGTNTAGKIGLAQGELDNITAGVLRIGSPTSGDIIVTAPIIAPATWDTLALLGGGTITEAAAGWLTLPNLRVSAAGPAFLSSANNVNTLAASTTNLFLFSGGTNSLTIGVVDGVSGVTTTGSDITLTADDLAIQQPVNAANGRVTLQPFSDTLQIDLGTPSLPGLTFGLTDTELNQVTAGVLQVGNTNVTGGLTVSSPVTRHAGFNTLSLREGGSISQTAPLSVANLDAFTTQGDITLVDAGNDVDTLAGGAFGGASFHYVDANALVIGNVDFDAGVLSNNDLTILAGGALTIDGLLQSFNTQVILTAGGPATEGASGQVLAPGLSLLGTGSYTLNSGSNDVNFLAASVTNDVSYTNANALVIATVAATVGVTSVTGAVDVDTVVGDLTVSQNVSAATTVTLTAGSAGASPDHVLTNNATISGLTGVTISADRMALQGGTITTSTGGSNVATLTGFTLGRTIDLGGTTDPNGTLTLSQAELNTITTDILRIGDFNSTGNITVTAPLTDATTGFTTLSLITAVGGGISQNSGAIMTVANLQAAGQTGVHLNENNQVTTLAGASQGDFSFLDSVSLTVGAVDSGLGAGFGNGIMLQGHAVTITVAAPGGLTVNGPVTTTGFGSAGGDIHLIANNMTFNAPVNAGSGIVTLNPDIPLITISIGGADAAGTLGLDDTDLGNVTAKVVRAGSAAQIGNISIDGTITRHAGYNTIDLNATGAASAAIVENGGSINVANLALQAEAGIGSAAALNVLGPINVTFQNLISNNVQVSTTGALTIAPVDNVNAAANNASGGTVTLSASSPMTFAVNTISSGTLTATTTETATETTTPLPPPDDDITVNSGVTVESTGGNVVFTSGDSIVTQSGSTLKSDTGAVNLNVGVGDNDNDATLVLNGSISSGGGVSLSAPGDICVSGINAPGQTVTITSTNGAILDCGDSGETEPASPSGDFSNGASVDITAGTLQLSAATGIGIVNAEGVGPLETQVNTLGADTSSGGIFITNGVSSAVTLSIAGTNGVQVTGASGDTQLTNQGTILLLTNGVSSSGGNITISADDMLINQAINAGAGIVTLQQAGTAARNIDLGGGTTPGDLGLSDTELGQVTASVLRIGRTDNSGSITITAPVTTHAGYNTLSLRSGGSISETATGAVSVTNLAVQATGGASLAANASAVSSVAASSAAGSLALLDALPLTVTTVDGVAGINTNGSALLESSIANTLLTVNQPVASATSFIEFTFDNMTLASTVSAAANELVELLPFSAGQFIDLGGTNTVGTLGLSNAELNEVSAGTLQIGDAVSGSITISAAIDVSAKVGTLDLETGGGITEKAGTVTVANLAIRAVNAVSMPQANDVTTGALAADVTGAGQGFTFTDANDLTIGTADGLNGATTNGGAITVDTAGNLTVNQNVSAGAATISLTAGGAESLLTSAAAISNSGGNTITIAANRMALGAAPASSITAAGGGRVILIATAAGRPINLGPTSDPTGSLNLSSAEVGTVSTTGVLQIGSGIEGDVSVGAPIGPINALTIDTAGGIGGISGAATITAASLRLSAGNAVNLPIANSVGVLAGTVTNAGQAFAFGNTAALDIDTVDTVSGITTNGGPITIGTIAGNLTVDQNVTAGTAGVGLGAGSTPASTDNFLTNNASINGTSALLTADRMALESGKINVGTGTSDLVTLQPANGKRAIDLGGVGDPTGTLQISQTELDTILAGIVRVGSDTAGNLTVTAPIAPVSFATLTLLSGGTITESGTGAVTVTNLDVQGAFGVDLSGNTGLITNLAGSANSHPFSVANAGALTVGAVDLQSGITTSTGNVTVQVLGSGNLLTINQPISAGNAAVNLTADGMAINAAVSAGTQSVTLLPNSSSRAIDLGTNTPGDLGLTDAELDQVTAGILRIGTTADTGAITISNTIDAEGHYATLSLATGDAIIEGATGKLQVPGLVLRAGTGIGSATPLVTVVSNLDFSNSTSGAVQISNTGAVTITALDSLAAASNPAGPITLTTTGSIIFAVDTIGSGVLTATAGESASARDDITVNSNVTVESTQNEVVLQAGDNINLPAGSTVKSVTTAVLLDIGFNDNDGDGGALFLFGVVLGTPPLVQPVNVQGSPGNDTFIVDTTGSSPLTLQGLAGSDTFNITPTATTPITLDGGTATNAPGNVLNFDAQGHALLARTGAYTAFGLATVSFTNIEAFHINNAAGISGFYGPDTVDRNQLAGLSPQQRFVRVLYLNALGRPGSLPELNAWVSVYNSSPNGQSVVSQDIEHSPEARDHLVRTWYNTFLGRQANNNEEQGWVNLLLAGAAEEAVLSGILASQEFYNRAQTLTATPGTADEHFVRALYLLLLNRTASTGEVDSWANTLPTGSRAAVAFAFLHSDEYRVNLIDLYYAVLLHRIADPGGFNGWFNSGADASAMRLGFDDSAEFFSNG